MSDIVIRNMEMPKSCFSSVHEHCPFFGDCTALRRFCDNHSNLEIINTICIERMVDCPLIVLSPHGRLIDADKLRMKYEYGTERKKVDAAPTVLEATE